MVLFFKSKERKEAEFMAPQLIKHVYESTDLINSTKKPDVFFFRYEFLIETVNKLVGMEKYLKFNRDKPSDLLNQINEKRIYTINDFIDRFYEDILNQINKLKTDKAKQKRINGFYTSLYPFFSQMEKENIDKIEELDKNLKNTVLSISNNAVDTDVKLRRANFDINSNRWTIMISFGSSSSKSYEKAVYLAKNSPKYEEIEDNDGNKTHTATYTDKKEDFLNFIILYDLVSNWKSTVFIINGKMVDKKTIGKIKYCYGDKCRSVKSNFCYGASYMTDNPFGCHRLQISRFNNPWWEYYQPEGNHYKLNRESIIDRIKLASDTFKYCPAFDIENIMKAAMSLPLILKKDEYEKLLTKESTIRID